jgi:uncharacterized protein YegL
MYGDPILAVNEGVQLLYRELNDDPQVVEMVHISIITFAGQADQYPLEPIYQSQPPTLIASGSTMMGDAFNLLVESIENDLRLNTETQHGDYRPLVFLLTDGGPTDNYLDPLNRLKALRGSRRPTIVALGCGSGADVQMLHEVTDNVFLMHNVSVDTLKGFFQWLSGSITQSSHSVGGGGIVMQPPTVIPGITYDPS